jgi:hypothetical protein
MASHKHSGMRAKGAKKEDAGQLLTGAVSFNWRCVSKSSREASGPGDPFAPMVDGRRLTLYS